jgi:hypothetical protein
MEGSKFKASNRKKREIVHKYQPSNITRGKNWTGGMALVVQHLTCKQEALNSNSSPI